MARFTSEFIGLDLEATDLSPERGGIIEIGAVRWKDGKEVAHYQTLIDPGTPIPPIITSITGIMDKDVHGKPSFDSVREELKKFIGSAPIVGHNIAFDINFLRAQGLPLPNVTYDTWKIATLVIPDASSHSLEALAHDLQLNHPEAHRALHDARVGAELFMYLAERVAELDATTAARIRSIIKNNVYSLTGFFEEVLAGPHQTPDKSIMPGWQGSAAHTDERPPAGEDTFTVKDIATHLQRAVSPTVAAFEVRSQQAELARLTFEALAKNSTTLIEATSGLGRRRALLVGACTQKVNGPIGYVVNGQHELDDTYPAAQSIAAYFKKSVAVIDQPNQYVYIPALEGVLDRTDLEDSQTHLAIKLLIWITKTKTGHLKEVAITWEERSLLEDVSCESHECVVQPEPQKCSFCRALVQAIRSDVVLLKHEMLMWLAHKAPEQLSFGGLIVDDADQLENNTVKYFGIFTHQERIERLLKRVATVAPELDLEPLRNKLTLLAGLVGVFLDHQALEAEWSGYRTISISGALENDPEFGRMRATLSAVADKMADLSGQLRLVQAPNATALAALIEEVHQALELFSRPEHPTGVVTLSLNADQKFVFKFEPVSAASYLATYLLEVQPLIIIGPRITVEQKFEFIKGRLGITKKIDEFMVQAPLRLAERTAVITLTDHPESPEPGWVSAMAHVIARTAQQIRGRVLVLFSGRGQVLMVHPEVEKLLAGSSIKLITQGLSGGRGKTTKALQRHSDAVVLSSHYFLRGRKFEHGFSAVILAKLPFEVPDQRYKLMRSKDSGSGFMTYDMPRVALKVREQFDRIIQGPRDRGVLIITDPKIQKGYGELVLQSLPGVPQTACASSKLGEYIAPFAKPAD
ncbi:MAG: exonuclease domain-containing protein [bacterium]|nr:exonuclease domain-containing protein [bacterium]